VTSMDEAVRFCVEHGTTSVGERDVRFAMDRLTRGPEGILDVARGRARLVAIIVERAETAGGAAELVPMGICGDADEVASLFDDVLVQAESLVRTLRVWIVPQLRIVEASLSSRGYREAYSSVTMKKPEGTLRQVAPPGGASFVDWSEAVASSSQVHSLVRRAFADVPGSIVLHEEELRARLSSSDPPARVLLRDGHLLGVCRTRASGPDGEGYVHMIARDPDLRGERLGDVLLAESLRILAERGATRFALDVIAHNRAALALYERHGFEVVQSDTAWVRG
jgi:ribosomal protein S18 acetylase RimI-like enzyme